MTAVSSALSSALSIAEQLQNECSDLLELFRRKENFPPDLAVADGRLVSVQLSSTLLDSQDKLWCLYSALDQCRTLMDKAISKEEEDLSKGQTGEYEKQRKVVKERVSFLIAKTGEIIRSQDSSARLPSSVGQEVECSTGLFELKLWVYRVYKELDYWAKMAISTLQLLHREPAGARRLRTTRSRR